MEKIHKFGIIVTPLVAEQTIPIRFPTMPRDFHLVNNYATLYLRRINELSADRRSGEAMDSYSCMKTIKTSSAISIDLEDSIKSVG